MFAVKKPPSLRDGNGYTALQYAERFKQEAATGLSATWLSASGLRLFGESKASGQPGGRQ